MSIAVSVRGLSKSYTIRHNDGQKHSTFAETVLHNVKNRFRRGTKETFWALKDLNFDVQQGDVVGIIGRNGAGKSTLLKILSRITQPTTGQVDMYGRVGSLLEVGTGFHPELTGRENIFLNGAILGMRKAEIRKQFEAIVDFAGVEQFLDTPVKRYSSGMYVRLAFAVAAHLRSEILIVDEVLAVGDAEFQKKCLGKMKDVAHDGRTVLFVSHNMASVRVLCRNAMLLRRGIAEPLQAAAGAARRYAAEMADPGGTIAAAIQYCHPHLSVSEITINGSPQATQRIASGTRRLEVRFKGVLKHAMRLDVEMWILDELQNCLAYFSPGHNSGATRLRPAGVLDTVYLPELPERLNSGTYHISLALADQDVCLWMNAPNAAVLACEGVPTGAGKVLLAQDGRGFIHLEGAERGGDGEPWETPRRRAGDSSPRCAGAVRAD